MTSNLQYKNFTDLDFNSIRSNLRTYLESQDTLQDYNFDGSVASVLLDILAFNTMYNAVYANMTASERFISTAQLRSSVVALAKNLGYIPRSVKAAKANITLTVSYTGGGTQPASILVPAGTRFTGKNSDGKTLVFFNRDNVYLENTSGSSFSATFDIYEGKKFTYKEVISSGQRGIQIPNNGVDTSLLTVTVKDTETSTTSTVYQKANDFTNINDQTNVYFVEEIDGEKHRIYFGDSAIGTEIVQGNEVSIEYYRSNGSAGNQVNSFTLSDTISNAQVSSIAVVSASSGGSDIEGIESIRANAPLFYQAQNRAVTARDYKTIIKTAFSDIEDLAVWGGEEADPPAYGKVYVAAMPEFGDFVSETRKNEIEEILMSEYSVMTISPVIVDPEYLYLELENNIEFSSSNTTSSLQEIKSQITAVINTYETENIRGFNKNFRLSKLSSLIDSVNSAISSNTSTIKMSIRPPDLEDVSQTNVLSFGNRVEAGTLKTGTFSWSGYSNVFLQDDSEGNIEIYRVVAGVDTPINDSFGSPRVAGTINYTTGKIVFNSNVFDVLDVQKIYGETLRINASPVLDDIKSDQSKVIRLCQECLTVNVTDLVTGISV